MKFVSCVWQHQHTPTQLQKTERISFQKVRIFFYFLGYCFRQLRMRKPGMQEVEKTRPLFICLFCMFFFFKNNILLLFFSPSWLFLFSPPWLEVDDHTCGPNLLKAFNKLLEKTKPSGFYSLKLSTLTLIHEYDWWQSKYETLKLNGVRIYYKPVWLPRSEFNESYTWLTEILQNTLCRACSSVWGKLNGDSPLPFNLDISLSKHKLHE